MSIPYYNDKDVHNNMINDKICRKVKLERIKKGYSQEQLALIAHISRTSVWKIETGQMSPTVHMLEKIAKALEIDFATLVDVSKVNLED